MKLQSKGHKTEIYTNKNFCSKHTLDSLYRKRNKMVNTDSHLTFYGFFLSLRLIFFGFKKNKMFSIQ